jgi:hypothetical protein
MTQHAQIAERKYCRQGMKTLPIIIAALAVVTAARARE